MDLLLSGGTVADGTGTPARRADVLVRGGRVAAITGPGTPPPAGAAARDATGCVVCPGFVDLHTHSDLTVLSGPQARSKVHQGVTTEVVGNCGLGVAPLAGGAQQADIRKLVSYLDLDPAVSWTWEDTRGYLDAVRMARPSLNIATLTGHVPLRAGVVGLDSRPATPAERRRMCDLLAESFAQGSAGVSTGMMYPPACYATDDELAALGRTAAEHGRVFAWHLRDYGDDLLPSVRQALDIGARAGCRVQISHLTAVGRRNWGGARRALDLVDKARGRGLDVAVDMYPYLFGNAPLAQVLPDWAQQGGAAAISRRLARADVRARIRAAWANRAVGWDEITLSWAPEASSAAALVGRTVQQAARAAGADSGEFVLDLLSAHTTSVLMIAGGRGAADLRAVLDHPAAVVASDGLSLDPDGVTGAGSPHPRSYGCFPRFLADCAGVPDARLARRVAQCTGAPARVAGLTDRGVLRPGAPADIVVFARDGLRDRATFDAPQRYPDGVELVLVNGVPVVDRGRHTGARPGVVITR